MRYADGPTVEVDVVIGALPAAVWALVTDIDLPARFSTEFLGARWLSGSAETVGARFAGRNFHAATGEWETTCTVIESSPPSIFAYVVGDPDEPSATWRYSLTPDGDGTHLTYWMQMGPAPSGLNVAIERMPDKEERIIARRCSEHRANMLSTLEGIRSLAEGTSP